MPSLGLLQQPGDARLRHAQVRRDLGLPNAVLVIQPSDLAEQTKLVRRRRRRSPLGRVPHGHPRSVRETHRSIAIHRRSSMQSPCRRVVCLRTRYRASSGTRPLLGVRCTSAFAWRARSITWRRKALPRRQQPTVREPGHADLSMCAGIRDPQVAFAPVGLPRGEAVGRHDRHAQSGRDEAAHDGQVVGLEGGARREPGREAQAVGLGAQAQEGRSMTKSSSATSSRRTSVRSARRCSRATASTSGWVNRCSSSRPPRSAGGR